MDVDDGGAGLGNADNLGGYFIRVVRNSRSHLLLCGCAGEATGNNKFVGFRHGYFSLLLV